MPSRRQLLVAVLGAASSALAQDNEAPRRVILDASRALQAGNPDRFMSYFDKRLFGGSSELRRTVSALLATRTVASSVDLVSVVDTSNGKAAQVDWLLQLTPLAGSGELETRRQQVELTLAQQSPDEWRITSFEPIEFFRVL